MNNDFVWVIDQEYRDLGVKSKEQGYPPEDEFTSKLSIDRKQNWGIPNSRGIRKLASGEAGKRNDSLEPAAIILITAKHKTVFHNPWEDLIDYTTGNVLYWGDAKFSRNKSIDEWQGNKLLLSVYNHILNGDYHLCPPILYFVRERAGYVIFKGLCVLDSVEKTWFIDKEKRVANYKYTFSILNASEINPLWLVRRAKMSNEDPNNDIVPEAWLKYRKTGIKDKLLVWEYRVKTKHQQLPVPGSPGEKLIRQLEKINPFVFEAVICNLIKGYSNIVHNIYKTSDVRDGGFDLQGNFYLPNPFKYPIQFKGEVKRHKQGIGPSYLSRLVARLSRGEYGLFFTTSYYTEQAQREVIIDNYPLRLFCAADLYDLFYEAKVLDEKGIRKDWLELIIKSYKAVI